ncbi:ABC transporter ATP-binding protein [Bacillus altitudinis]|uniref:ABC transporter ATP-binding protein n=1 Tax=Bacillus altitudinis TaxID=293387 RepID=UPI00064E977D|nr:ABC transporter ATP-binding protein [Bacillus altitudinis]KML03910.1 sugar ABC transporter ATP-binding protein [Bacillus stratosphericus]KML59066.1 sugar ABC transporter ATP-binding protein [Bacillus stratosphericus]MEC1182026.1 ABC transporter ATP-binding protein [Bacillus altitudinis]
MSGINLEHISQHFGEQIALDNVSLTVKEGEFFSLLGPSGCGKSTLLNIIGGFLEPTKGVVYIGDQDVTTLPPYQRKTGMVFQSYALFPHLTVFDNVAYGLKVQKKKKAEIKQKVMESLSLVQLESFAKRMPHQLSGGQQQRVAIARALAIQPAVLLLDEPLSNLDAKLRKNMQTELRNIQRNVGITTILVTHDQEEALSLSDRIGILGEGKIQQIGTPLEVYRQPNNRFVAEFIGQVNLFEAEYDEVTSTYTVPHFIQSNGKQVQLKAAAFKEKSEKHLLMLRPERIKLSSVGEEVQPNHVTGVLADVSYIGHSLRLVVGLNQGEIIVHASDAAFPELPQVGETVHIHWQPEDIVFLDSKVHA